VKLVFTTIPKEKKKYVDENNQDESAGYRKVPFSENYI
jgi:hypothetical protein